MGSQWLIVGLGNPGAAYRGTRHNAGRMLVERLAEKAGTAWERKPALKAELARIEAGPSTNLLCKPLVYMNVSGEAVGAAARYFRIPPERVLVCVDDADLPLGVIRLRPGGGTGGHRGLESIQAHLGADRFPRLRLGIGGEREGQRDLTGFVLGKFRPEEKELVEKALERAAEQVFCCLSRGLEAAMSRYNGPVEARENGKG